MVSAAKCRRAEPEDVYASMLGMDMACVPPAVDASAPLDAETATDTGMSDSVAPTDAPSDAVSE